MSVAFQNVFCAIIVIALTSCATMSSQTHFTTWSNSLPKVNQKLFDKEVDPIKIGAEVGLLKLENGCIYFHQAVNPAFMKGIDEEGLRELKSEYGELKIEQNLTLTKKKFVVVWPEDTTIIQKGEIVELYRQASSHRVATLNIPIKLLGRSNSKISYRGFKKYLNPMKQNFCNLSAPVIDPSAWDIFKLS